MLSDVSDSMHTSASNRTSKLPPCRVCGDIGSGFHYGANTCEACKVFFMRTIKHHMRRKEKCPKDNLCQIKADKRKCHTCRFQRCLSIGMSKNAIKIGRYTIHKRLLLREEVAIRVEGLDPNLGQIPEELYQGIAKRLSESSLVHDIHSLVTRDPDALLQRQKEYLDWYFASYKTIGERNRLSDSENSEFYKVTGIDIDDRNAILHTTVEMLQYGIEKHVKFSKTIPGFKKLSLADQANIIKGKLNKLGLLDEEIAVLKALCILFTDRVVLEDKSAVDGIQWTLIWCLRWLLKRNHSNDKNMFFKLWDCIILLREVSEGTRQFAENVEMRCPVNVDCSLLKEIKCTTPSFPEKHIYDLI